MFAMTLPEIFPEICSTVPKIYLTSERFKPFNKLILKSINPSISGYSVPNVEFVDFVPVVINKKGRFQRWKAPV